MANEFEPVLTMTIEVRVRRQDGGPHDGHPVEWSVYTDGSLMGIYDDPEHALGQVAGELGYRIEREFEH